MNKVRILQERVLSFLKGDAAGKKQVEEQGKGIMYGFGSYGASYHSYVNQTYTLEQKRMRIREYRELEFYPEVADAIDLTVDSCIQRDMEEKVIKLEILNEDLKLAKRGKIAELLQEEWDHFLEHVYGGEQMLRNNFRRWLVDGELWVENVKGNNGYSLIKTLPPETMLMILNEKGSVSGYVQNIGDWSQAISYGIGGVAKFTNTTAKNIVQFNPEEITYIDSNIFGPGGLIDPRSRLEYALRSYRQLKLLEDAVVIYRLIRAPEKRIFNVDVGTLPKGQAEEYMKKLISQYRSKQVYDPSRGDVVRQYNPISMTEDIWIPSRGGSGGTKIDTLAGGANLGNITDVEYFLKKIYKALKVPSYLTEAKEGISDKTQQTRQQDVRFARHCETLQYEWAQHIHKLFVHHLRIKAKKLDKLIEDITYRDVRLNLTPPSYYKEFKDIEVVSARVTLFNSMQDTGAFTRPWLMKNVLKMTEDEIREVVVSIEDDKDFTDLDVNIKTGTKGPFGKEETASDIVKGDGDKEKDDSDDE